MCYFLCYARTILCVYIVIVLLLCYDTGDVLFLRVTLVLCLCYYDIIVLLLCYYGGDVLF